MIVVILMAALAGEDIAPPVFYAPNEEVRGYIMQAIAGEGQHPALNATMEEYHAGMRRIPQETALDDPMFQATYWTRSSAGEGRYSIMMSQMFPWFGTLKTRGEKAEAEAGGKLAQFYAERNERIAEIKKAYVEYWFLGERTRIALDQVNVLSSLEDLVRSRYALGIGGQEDLLRIEMEEAKLQAGYDCCALERAALAGKLNESIGREAATELPFPQPMELPPPPPPAPVVLARIRVANPALDEADANIESKEKEVALARKKGKPNFTVGVSYTDMKDLRNEPRTGPLLNSVGAASRLSKPAIVRSPLSPQGATLAERVQNASDFRNQAFDATLNGAMDVNSFVELENAFDNLKMKDEVMVSVGMNLPIWRSKVKAGVQEAEHMKMAAEHDKRKTIVALEGAAKMAIYGMEDGYRRLKLYDEKLLPQVKRTYETLEDAYAAGNSGTSFLDVLTTVQTKLEFEQERARAVRDIHVAASDLELILGGPWTASESAPLPELSAMPPALESSASPEK